MKIPITKPVFGDTEREVILKPLETGWVVQGPFVSEFEKLFAAYTGSAFALATTSCTTALHLGVVAAGIGAGDEVIVPSFTWVATANVVEMQGAKPVFADIDLATFNIDTRDLESRITGRTKAVMPVSLFGVSAAMAEVLAIARPRSLNVIEDDACALGAWAGENHAGTLADTGCFSFHPRKAITTGEGGMIITQDTQKAALLRSLRDHGATTSDLARHLGAHSYLLPDFPVLGFNYRMTDLQGALGTAQMGRLEWILTQRARRAAVYDEAFARLGWLKPQKVPKGFRHGYQSYVCLFAPEEPSLKNVERLNRHRNALMDRLEAEGIATRPGTHAVHMLTYYREKYGLKPEDLPNAYLADQLTLTLPLYAEMTEEEQQYVIEHLEAIGPGAP
jgi:dTDP-4-amino-4,6-dideoxygalactose transaminase